MKTKTPIDEGAQHNDIARRATLAVPLRDEKILKMQILMTLVLLIHLPTLRNFASIYSYSCAEYNPYYEFYRDIKYYYMLARHEWRIQLRHIKRDSLHAN